VQGNRAFKSTPQRPLSAKMEVDALNTPEGPFEAPPDAVSHPIAIDDEGDDAELASTEAIPADVQMQLAAAQAKKAAGTADWWQYLEAQQAGPAAAGSAPHMR
jgi:hypothetical protein